MGRDAVGCSHECHAIGLVSLTQFHSDMPYLFSLHRFEQTIVAAGAYSRQGDKCSLLLRRPLAIHHPPEELDRTGM